MYCSVNVYWDVERELPRKNENRMLLRMLFPIAKLGNHKYVFHEKSIKNKIILTRGLFFVKRFYFSDFFVKW